MPLKYCNKIAAINKNNIFKPSRSINNNNKRTIIYNLTRFISSSYNISPKPNRTDPNRTEPISPTVHSFYYNSLRPTNK